MKEGMLTKIVETKRKTQCKKDRARDRRGSRGRKMKEEVIKLTQTDAKRQKKMTRKVERKMQQVRSGGEA